MSHYWFWSMRDLFCYLFGCFDCIDMMGHWFEEFLAVFGLATTYHCGTGRLSPVPLSSFWYHAMDFDPESVSEYLPFVVFTDVAFPLIQEDLPLWLNMISGLNNLHAYALRPGIPFRWLHEQRLLSVVQRSVDSWWLAFAIIGLSPMRCTRTYLVHCILVL